METRQNTPSVPEPTDISDADAENKPLSIQQQLWIDYNALNGLITDNMEERLNRDGEPITMRKMPITEFAELIKVHRDTLRRWRTEIPNFWVRVNERRRAIAPQSRLQRVHEVWYLSALKPGEKGYRDRLLWLANFDDSFRTPTQKHEHEVGGGLADLLQAHRKQKQIEAAQQKRKVIDATPNNPAPNNS